MSERGEPGAPEAGEPVEEVADRGDDRRLTERILEEEMRESFIDYSMSVNTQRALPDVRDGLKPVHRRILYAMSQLGLSSGRPYKKCATVVGDVLGKYHPHGDGAVYDALVRMAQEFSLRYPLADGQGNFGSIDGDGAAAYRYTESRLARISAELLSDINKETVDFRDNFDGRLKEPVVLPSAAPNLLVNGSTGIAVGMSTNIPPHNLGEIIDGLLEVIADPETPDARLEELIAGPDFPTGGIICGREGIRKAYRTGMGRVLCRAKVEEPAQDEDDVILVREIPYMVNKANLIEKIAHLVRQKTITDIRDLRDESDRDGMRIVIELKQGASRQVVLNQLYRHTQMQETFGIILRALDNGRPKLMTLRGMLRRFLRHREDVVLRRARFELKEARKRKHVCDGLRIAVVNIDQVVALIRESADQVEAAVRLRRELPLDEIQTRAILEMRLGRLTGLEIDKLEKEIRDLAIEIAAHSMTIESKAERLRIVEEDLRRIKGAYGDARRTLIAPFCTDGPIISDDEMVVTISHKGYVKRTPIESYPKHHRGGKGLKGPSTGKSDRVKHLFISRNLDRLLLFTVEGICHALQTWELPEGSRTARGRFIGNVLPNIRAEIASGDVGLGGEPPAASPIASVFVARRSRSADRAPEAHPAKFLLFCTRGGHVKKTPISAFDRVWSNGKRAIRIREGDRLIDAQATTGHDEVFLGSANGQAIRFSEMDARPMGRDSMGVMGIRLRAGDHVVGMVVGKGGKQFLSVTESGLGKRTELGEYRLIRRGGIGVIAHKLSEDTGRVVKVLAVRDSDQLLLLSAHGKIIRFCAASVRVVGRNAAGVRLMKLDAGDRVVDADRSVADDD